VKNVGAQDFEPVRGRGEKILVIFSFSMRRATAAKINSNIVWKTMRRIGVSMGTRALMA
jgi:hypothetical protein